MTVIVSSDATKKLLLQYIIENIEYRKRCLYLQDIINMGRENNIWHRALIDFFNDSMNTPSIKNICQN